MKRRYSAGDLKIENIPGGLHRDEVEEIKAFNEGVLRSENT
jgi:hypothetical protein